MGKSTINGLFPCFSQGNGAKKEQLELQREGLQRQRRKSLQASFETLQQIIQ
jgi:hypothetical protein